MMITIKNKKIHIEDGCIKSDILIELKENLDRKKIKPSMKIIDPKIY